MTYAGHDSLSRLPDFIIGGAPKCGTTSLHFILDQHPDVGMPEAEIHYFDADDPIAHPDFLSVSGGRLDWFDVRPSAGENRKWYASRFAPFEGATMVGEDSTTYLFSEAAPERINAMLPEVKTIFLLRDPVRRAYSQYWHLIRSARLSCSFEKALSLHSSIILGSTYAPHLRRYLDALGSERVMILVFEDFLAEPQAFIDRVTTYLGLAALPLDTVKTWFNRSSYPRWPRVHQLANLVGRRIVAGRYANHMGQKTGFRQRAHRKLHYYWFERFNPLLLTEARPPPMRPETASYLAQHFSARNAGLSELLGRDLSRVWPGFEG